MEFSFNMFFFVFIIQLAGYLIKCLIGFGNPLLAAPLLSMRLDNVVITPGSLLLDFPINAYFAWSNRKNFRWQNIAPLLVANICGIVPGTMLLQVSLPWILKTILGCVVVFLGLEMASRVFRGTNSGGSPVWQQVVVSFISGVCAGLFGINMLLVSFLQRTTKNYGEFKGSLCFMFVGENIFRTTLYLFTGLFTKEVLFFALATAAAVAVAALLARVLSPRLDEMKLQRAACILFLLGGVSIIVKSLIFHT